MIKSKPDIANVKDRITDDSFVEDPEAIKELACISRSRLILSRLQIWSEVIQDEEFRCTMNHMVSKAASAKDKHSAAMLKYFIDGDLEATRHLYKQTFSFEPDKVKVVDCVARQMFDSLVEPVWKLREWKCFNLVVSATISAIACETDNFKTDKVERRSCQSSISVALAMQRSQVFWLFNWTNTIDRPALYVRIADNIEKAKKIRCYYHFRSYIEVLIVGNQSQVDNLRFSHVRKAISSINFPYDYMFKTLNHLPITNESDCHRPDIERQSRQTLLY